MVSVVSKWRVHKMSKLLPSLSAALFKRVRHKEKILLNPEQNMSTQMCKSRCI